MPALTRGPLPPRVYWARRLLVLGTAFALVFGIGRLLSGGSDGSSGEDAAAQVAAGTSPTISDSVTDLTPSSTPSSTPGRRHGSTSPDPTPTLAEPEGECNGTDVAVTPKINRAVAGRDVRIVLQLRTLESEACTWQVDRNALTLSITSGKDQIWSSRQCPRAIPTQAVVVRRAVTRSIAVVWKEAKRSDEGCTRFTPWAMPGWYHVTAAALGGEPSDLQFELTTPAAATVTRTASPTQTPSDKPSNRPSSGPHSQSSGRPITKPSHSSSGAGEPD
jgi:hypothetical protein